MIYNLFKESSQTARVLGEELRTVLRHLDPAVGQPLLDRMTIEAHSTPLMVVTGYHSAGKSTLIEALTDRAFNIPIGSGITTNQVTEYDWDRDVRLVDTPGVRADRPDHDEQAERALQAADLVLFAVPVELFDDTLVAHLHDVLGRLAKSRQTLLVITKAGTMDAAPGHRAAAIKDALAAYQAIPWVECDAQYYLDGLDLRDTAPEDSRAFIDASGLTKVSDLINEFASQQGELGKLSRPLQLIIAISLEASASLATDPSGQAALTVLARQRSALSRKHIHLVDLLEARSAQFRADAVRAATRFADDTERDEQGAGLEDALPGHTATLNEALGTALERFESSVKQVLELQFADLSSEVLAIEDTRYGRLTVQLGEMTTASFEGHEIAVRPGKASASSTPGWAPDLSTHLRQFNKFWGAGDGLKAASGSNGHRVVLEVGHAFGKKFKPWEAVKTANTIGKIAKVGGAATTVGIEAYGVIAEERAAVKAELARTERRRRVTQEILAQADAIAADALADVHDDLDRVFKPEFERIDALAEQIHATNSTRAELRERLTSIQRQASSALDALAVSSVAPDPQVNEPAVRSR
ncbi:hypothetical protein GCM10027425_02290 [Alteromonas gracilis]